MNQNHQMQQIKNVFFLVLGSVVYGIGTHSFVMPANIAPGGAVGLALIVNYLSGLPVGILTIFLNIPLLALEQTVCDYHRHCMRGMFGDTGFWDYAFSSGL